MAVMQNYMELKEFADELDDNDKTDVGSKEVGFSNQLGKFKTFFSLSSLSKVFTAIGSVNQTMQACRMRSTIAAVGLQQTAADFNRFVTMQQELVILFSQTKYKPPNSVQMYQLFEMIGN